MPAPSPTVYPTAPASSPAPTLMPSPAHRPTLLFAGHDPGSLNHVRPIAAAAFASGLFAACPVVNLRPTPGSSRGPWGGVTEVHPKP
jgi:hypothetical protein